MDPQDYGFISGWGFCHSEAVHGRAIAGIARQAFDLQHEATAKRSGDCRELVLEGIAQQLAKR
jgi:hypothetical protein